MKPQLFWRYRRAAANWLDIGFPAKEQCREFAKPTQSSFLKLKRSARYLHHHRHLVYEYKWCDIDISPSADVFEVYVDTEFAVCGQTRRSTSGGTYLYHGHRVKHCGVTQSTLSLSSGESELDGISNGVSTALGMQSVARDLGF